MNGGREGGRARPSDQALVQAPSREAVSALAGFDPSRVLLQADCTGDETLWVLRYASYFKSVSGCDLAEAIVHANAAWDTWGNDPETTPEEIASSDYAEMLA